MHAYFDGGGGDDDDHIMMMMMITRRASFIVVRSGLINRKHSDNAAILTVEKYKLCPKSWIMDHWIMLMLMMPMVMDDDYNGREGDFDFDNHSVI